MQDAAAESGAPAHELRETLHKAQASLARIDAEITAAGQDRAALLAYLAALPPGQWGAAAAAIEATAAAIDTRVRVLGDAQTEIRAQTAAITRAALTAATLTLVGPSETAAPAPAGPRHRRTRGNQGMGPQRDTSSHLRLLGLSPLAELARYLGHAPWSSAAAIAITGTLVQAVPPAPQAVPHTRTAARHGDVSPTLAAPIPLPGVRLYPRSSPSARTAATSGRPISTLEVPGFPGPTAPASTQPSTQPTTQPTVSATAAAGRLLLGSPSLDLGSGISGTVTLTAAGGPVTWSADNIPAGVTLSSYGGTIAAGQAVQLTVTVSATAAILPGSTMITLDPGQELSLSWAGVPVPAVTQAPVTPGA